VRSALASLDHPAAGKLSLFRIDVERSGHASNARDPFFARIAQGLHQMLLVAHANQRQNQPVLRTAQGSTNTSTTLATLTTTPIHGTRLPEALGQHYRSNSNGRKVTRRRF
jgi:hypothetical protein